LTASRSHRERHYIDGRSFFYHINWYTDATHGATVGYVIRQTDTSYPCSTDGGTCRDWEVLRGGAVVATIGAMMMQRGRGIYAWESTPSGTLGTASTINVSTWIDLEHRHNGGSNHDTDEVIVEDPHPSCQATFGFSGVSGSYFGTGSGEC
jgi:hypothetical protein